MVLWNLLVHSVWCQPVSAFYYECLCTTHYAFTYYSSWLNVTWCFRHHYQFYSLIIVVWCVQYFHNPSVYIGFKLKVLVVGLLLYYAFTENDCSMWSLKKLQSFVQICVVLTETICYFDLSPCTNDILLVDAWCINAIVTFCSTDWFKSMVLWKFFVDNYVVASPRHHP